MKNLAKEDKRMIQHINKHLFARRKTDKEKRESEYWGHWHDVKNNVIKTAKIKTIPSKSNKDNIRYWPTNKGAGIMGYILAGLIGFFIGKADKLRTEAKELRDERS